MVFIKSSLRWFSVLPKNQIKYRVIFLLCFAWLAFTYVMYQGTKIGSKPSKPIII